MSNEAAGIPIQLAGGDPLHRFILETFATAGRSPTLEEIRVHFTLPTLGEADAMVAALVRSGAIHRNPGDPAITHAYPFSNEPTAHRVQLAGGPDVYAMCAIDALGMPFMLRRDAEIASACAQCGAAVRVGVRDGVVGTYEPRGTVVWLADRTEGCVAATDLCPDLNFFCTTEHLRLWATADSGRTGQRLTFDEALAHGRQVFEGLLYGRDDCCSP
jgi:hypothetical protein